MLTGKELYYAIASRPGEKVTKEYMESRIKHVTYLHHSASLPTLTVCAIILDNGYHVLGESACVDPINFDPKIGQSLAYQNAFNKLWPLFGFLLAECRYNATKAGVVNHD
jgi:hypothetical protein